MEQEADAAKVAAQHLEGETPLNRFLLALYESGDAGRLIKQIAVYVHQAGLPGAQSAHEIALEIFQDVVVELLRKQESYDPQRNGRSWLLGFALNLIKRRRATQFRVSAHEIGAGDLSGASSVMDEAGAPSETEILDRFYALHAAQGGDSSFGQRTPEQVVLEAARWEALLSHLLPQDRRLIELTVLEGMKASEVGQELGISETNARVRLCRVLKKLRSLWIDSAVNDSAVNDSAVNDSAVNDEEKHSHES